MFVLFTLRKRERELRDSTNPKRRLPLRRGRVSKQLLVPEHIPKPPYVGSKLLPEISKEHQIHDSEGIAHMKAACELAARVVDYAGTLVRVRIDNLYLFVKFEIHFISKKFKFFSIFNYVPVSVGSLV